MYVRTREKHLSSYRTFFNVAVWKLRAGRQHNYLLFPTFSNRFTGAEIGCPTHVAQKRKATMLCIFVVRGLFLWAAPHFMPGVCVIIPPTVLKYCTGKSTLYSTSYGHEVTEVAKGYCIFLLFTPMDEALQQVHTGNM